MSLKNQIFASHDLKTEVLDIFEWGIPNFNIRELTAAQRGQLFEKIQDLDGKPIADDQYFAILVSMGAIDADGERIFSDEDVDALLEKSPFVLRRIGKAINTLSGITTDSVSEAEKN